MTMMSWSLAMIQTQTIASEKQKTLISAIKTPDFFCGKNKNQNLFPTTSSLLPPSKNQKMKIFDDDIFSI